MTSPNSPNIIKKILPVLIVILAAILAFWLIGSGDLEQKKSNSASEKRLRIVKVMPIPQENFVPKWQSSGLVKATESVTITPEITGLVDSINELATPGALIEKGTWLVKLKPEDYLLNVQTQQAQLDSSQAKLELELADQRLAKEELSLITDLDNMNVDLALVLREPQLKSAEAQLTIAQVNLKKAQVALQRAQIYMPYKGMIETRDVGVGKRVGTNTALFDVINVERFWLEVKVSRSFLALLDTTAKAIITQPSLWNEQQQRSASFISVLPSLDEKDRQVKLLYEIKNPLSEYPALYIHDFLKVELKGKEFKNAWAIQSSWMQDDSTIWVVDKKNKLAKRNVDILFKGQNLVYVKGDIKNSDRALNEKIPGAIVGMQVKPKMIELPITKEQPNANE